MEKKDIDFLENSVNSKTLKEYNDLLNCKNVNKQDLLVLLYSIYDFLYYTIIKYKRSLFDYYLFVTAYNFYYLFSKNNDNLKKQVYLYKESLKNINSCCKDLIKYIEKVYFDIDVADTSLLYLIFAILINNDKSNNSYFDDIITQFECDVKNINFFSNSDININKVNDDNIKLKEITNCLKKTYKMN